MFNIDFNYTFSPLRIWTAHPNWRFQGKNVHTRWRRVGVIQTRKLSVSGRPVKLKKDNGTYTQAEFNEQQNRKCPRIDSLTRAIQFAYERWPGPLRNKCSLCCVH